MRSDKDLAAKDERRRTKMEDLKHIVPVAQMLRDYLLVPLKLSAASILGAACSPMHITQIPTFSPRQSLSHVPGAWQQKILYLYTYL